MLRLNKTLASLFLFWLLACASLSAGPNNPKPIQHSQKDQVLQSILPGPKDPIEGEHFQTYVELQNVELQKLLKETFPEEDGFIVSGPLAPPLIFRHIFAKNPYNILYDTPRIICPSISQLETAIIKIKKYSNFYDSISMSFLHIEQPGNDHLTGYRGGLELILINDEMYFVQFLTLQQLRFLIWAGQHLDYYPIHDTNKMLGKYALAVSDYFYEIDKGNLEAPEPKAVDFGLDEKYDLYAPAPDYVIQGYQNYKDYLKSHAEIITSKLSEILAFVPTESGLERLKSEAPDIAYPNKEFPLLQEEFRKFIRRGGKMSYMRTLTKKVFDTLKSAEYFFAVGLSGKVRFGRELLREEVKLIEQQTGQKPARANHAFLFVGEPILTAGAFFIENEDDPRIVEVNTQSGHYFYSNITSTIREDVAERSNDYFMTIGHFFRALDSLEIEYHNVLLRKL